MAYIDHDSFLSYTNFVAPDGLLSKWTSYANFAATYVTPDAGGRGVRMTVLAGGPAGLIKQIPATQQFAMGGVGKFENRASANDFNDLAFFGYAGGAGLDGTTQVQCRLNMRSDGSIRLYRTNSYQGTTTLLATSAAGLIQDSVEFTFDLEYFCDDSVGRLLLNINGAQAINFSGDTKQGSTALIDFFGFGPNNTCPFTVSHVWWRDDDVSLGPCRISTCLPTSDGGTLNWTPSTGTSHYAVVDEAQVSTADYLSASTVGNRDILGLADLPVTPATIHQIQVKAWAQKTDVASREINLGVGSGATVSDGTGIALSTTNTLISRTLTQDPNTSAAWGKSAIDALTLQPNVAV